MTIKRKTQGSYQPTLPSVVKTLSGAIFDPNNLRWSFHDGLQPISLNFERLRGCATEAFIEAMKFPLVWYAENTEGVSLRGLFQSLKQFLVQMASIRGYPVDVIDSSLLISFRASLTANTEWKLGDLTGLFKKWGSLGAPGITDDAVRFIKTIRLKGNRKGVAVLTMDPLEGPLTDMERSAVQAALNENYAMGKIALDDYILAWLALLLGQRPIQYAMLKVGDVEEVVKSDGTREYVLKIPRAKQQSDKTRRHQLKERLITPSIGKLLLIHADIVKEQLKEKFSEDPLQAPLFPQRLHTKSVRPAFHFHATPGEIGSRIRKILSGLNVYSERTGRTVKTTAKRLRHTIATVAAREGHGELIIAELLDHSDTQNVGVYVKATPEIVERIDHAIALHMAPLAKAFVGNFICDESEAARGDDPTSRIVDPRFDEKMRPMGSCGRSGACEFWAPIACYTCKSFQAWVDGPHEKVLLYLLAERERQIRDVDARIASINDRTILAVAAVVRHIRELRGESIDDC